MWQGTASQTVDSRKFLLLILLHRSCLAFLPSMMPSAINHSLSTLFQLARAILCGEGGTVAVVGSCGVSSSDHGDTLLVTVLLGS